MKISKLSHNLIYRGKQKKVIAFFVEHKKKWFTISEVKKFCFNDEIFRNTLTNILYELPLLERKKNININGTHHNVFCYRYTSEIEELKLMPQVIGRSKRNFVDENANTIRSMRLKAGLSQEKLAKELDVAPSTIIRWEKSLAEPTMTIVQTKKLCRLFSISLHSLPDSLIKKAISF